MTERPGLIVWLDPGKTTGLASWDAQAEAFRSWQYDENDLMKRLATLSDIYDGHVAVGWEKYQVTGGGGAVRGSAHWSHEIIGLVSSAATSSTWTILPSMPSSARALANAQYLQRLGWYKPGKGHANDAALHLLAYLLRCKPMCPYVRQKLFPGYGPTATIAP